MTPAAFSRVWSIESRGALGAFGFLLGLGLLVAGRSSRTGSATATLPPPRLILDPNTAPGEILTALPGLGPGLVRNWVEARRERPFRSLDDLERRVRGIGPATLARIAPYLEIAGK
jgi:competence protein ComEA